VEAQRDASTAAASIELYGTFHAMGVIVTIAAAEDPDGDATATVEYRTGGQAYQVGFPLSRVDDTRFVGSLFWLEPGTTYDVRVTFSDPNGDPLDGVIVTASGATRFEIAVPSPTHSYYITPDGNGTACSLAAPCSLTEGISQAQAGDEVVLRGGVYYQGEMYLPRSGTTSAPIVIRSYEGETAILDGADPATFTWTAQGGGVYLTTVNVADTHLVTADGQRLYPYELYQRPGYSESDGTVQLDFSASDPQYEYFLDTRGVVSFNLPGIFDENDDRYLIRDATGTRYRNAAFDDPVFTDKATQYYQLLRDHYTAQGWFDRHFTYFTDETEWVSDEPLHNGPDGLQRLLDWASLVKGVDPAFKVVAASVYPIPPGPPDRGWVDLVGYVDWWSIASDEVEQDPEIYRQRVALGETLSLYFNDYGDFIDYKATLHRALGSLAYKYDAAALEGWAVAAWVGDANSMDIINPWLSTPDPVYGNGAGALFWPGHKIEGDGLASHAIAEVDGPLPSIRLELAREAAEDYEYLTMLAAQTSEGFARGLTVNLLPQPLRAIDPDPEDFYAFRDLMGEILSGQHPVTLAAIQGTVTESGSGAPVAGVLISNGQGAALTNDDGAYTLAVEVGDQTITASRDRYTSAQQAVTVGAGATVTVDFALDRVAEESTLFFSFETAGEVADWEFENTISQERTSQHVTDGVWSLKVVFGDSSLPNMGAWQFPTDWSNYTALEFDVYNESDYYTYFYVGVGDNAGGWYPATGGDTLLLPNASNHVVVPIAEMARDVDVSNVDWLEFEPETLMEEENYQGQTKSYPLGPRTLYFDNIRLVRVN